MFGHGSMSSAAHRPGHVADFLTKGIAMKSINALIIGTVSIAFVVAGGGAAAAQSQDQDASKKKARWDRVKMVADVGGMAVGVGGMALGAVAFNPVVVGLGAASFGASTASLGVHSYQLVKHSNAEQGNATTSAAPTNYAQTESLLAVPGRPGYFYYPSNPNQLYFDANAAAAAEPMQAKIPEPARINVLIANTAKDGRIIHYSVSGTSYSVPPGYIQALTAPAGSIIAYDRGDQAGTEQFTLTDGTYEFRTAEQGWRFYTTNPALANVAKSKSDTKPTEASKLAATVR
jgi:hypothetical protein